VVQVDAHAPFDKGRLVVQRLVHKSACAGLLGGAWSRSLGIDGVEALPRWDPARLAALAGSRTRHVGTLEPVGLRKGSNARALIIPNSGDLGHLFEPFEGQVSNP
jgi:hypothetical protein